MKIFKVGMLLDGNKVRYTEMMIFNDFFPIELNIGYMTEQDIYSMLQNSCAKTCTLKNYYSTKNPDAAFLFAKKRWLAILQSGETINVLDVLKLSEIAAKQEAAQRRHSL